MSDRREVVAVDAGRRADRDRRARRSARAARGRTGV